jgi:hypothetical protein
MKQTGFRTFIVCRSPFIVYDGWTMLGLAWLTLRQAQEALDNGRLEEAHRLLETPDVRGHKGTAPLLRQLAQMFVERGAQHLRHENITAAWNDLRKAEQLGDGGSKADQLRQELTKKGLAEVQKLLDAGEPSRATESVAQLKHGTAPQADIQLVEEVSKGWCLARDLAARGEFALALETVERIHRLLPKTVIPLERFRYELRERRPAFSDLLLKLHEAAAQQRWQDVVNLSDQALALAPQHGETRKARARAWKAIEPAHAPGEAARRETASSRRFLLWIDGAGGYLVCLAPRVTLGQAAPDGHADVPLFADIARSHATIARDSEGYVLESTRPLQVNGQSTEKALLQPGDRITLGSCCQLQFRQPVPVSATARLDLMSGHRFPLAVDGVILMADTLMLGPTSHAHVTIPDMERPAILFRQKDGLGVRYAGNLVVDGQACKERGTLGPTSKVRGDDVAFAVETVGGKFFK